MVILRSRDLVWGWSFGKVMCPRARIKDVVAWACFEFGCEKDGEE